MTQLKHYFAIITVFFVFTFSSYAQFEQKFTFHISSGLIIPYGDKTYEIPDQYGVGLKLERPYILANFNSGTFLNIGVQHNLSRSLSIGAKFRPVYLFGWDYVDKAGVDWTNNISMSLLNLGIGINGKYKFMPSKKLNPFLFAELSINYTSLSYSFTYFDTLVQGNGQERAPFLENSIGLGYNLGIGADYALNDKLGIFLQAGYNTVFINSKNYNSIYYDGFLEKENFKAIYIELGLNLSFLKSKKL